MLKEIHHRVKNNLQVISSLLSLQAEEIADEGIQRHLRESQNRIRSMAIIHQRLYRSSNLAEISIGGYADELCSQLARSYGLLGRETRIQVKAEEIVLSVDVAIPCGIILNELVSNALKYAFPPEQGGGTVTVTIRRAGEKVQMEIRDDGVGLPAEMDLRNADSLGLRLVTMLAEQIGATVDVAPAREGKDGSPGTAWTVEFREHGLEPAGRERGPVSPEKKAQTYGGDHAPHR
jgi:two-component sensor histidine kinase